MPSPATFLDRYWAKVDVRGKDECWEWKRARYHDDYGCLGIRVGTWRTTMRASAFSLILATGEDANGRFALHTCDNPPCCNPAHLYWGDQTRNIADMDRRGRRVRVGSPGERHPNHKLTQADVLRIREDWAQGATQQSLATRFGISQVNVSYIVRRKSWAHVA